MKPTWSIFEVYLYLDIPMYQVWWQSDRNCDLYDLIPRLQELFVVLMTLLSITVFIGFSYYVCNIKNLIINQSSNPKSFSTFRQFSLLCQFYKLIPAYANRQSSKKGQSLYNLIIYAKLFSICQHNHKKNCFIEFSFTMNSYLLSQNHLFWFAYWYGLMFTIFRFQYNYFYFQQLFPLFLGYL